MRLESLKKSESVASLDISNSRETPPLWLTHLLSWSRRGRTIWSLCLADLLPCLPRYPELKNVSTLLEDTLPEMLIVPETELW